MSGVMETPGDIYIIAIEKVIPKTGTAVEILFLCVLETK